MKGQSISVSSFFASILKFSVSSWINFVIGLVSVVITTRIFTPDIYGTLNMFNTASGFLASFACLGLNGAFLRFFHEPPPGWSKQQLFAKCLVISVLVLGLLFLVGLAFFYADISLRLFNQVSFMMTALLGINSLSTMVLGSYYSQYYRLDNNAWHYSIQSVLVQFCSKILVIGAAFVSPTAEVVLLFNTVGLFFLMIVYSLIQKRTVWPARYRWERQGFGEVLRYGLFSWPLTAAFSASAFLIPFIIQTRLDSYALGIFASTGFFVAAFNVVQSGFRTYWAAFMYGHYREEQPKIKAVHTYILLFVLFLLGGFILCQHPAYLMIGSRFHESRVFFSLVLLDPLLMLVEQTTNYGMALAKRNQEMTLIYLLAILLNIGLCYALLPLYGLPGAAAAAAVAALFRFVLATWRGQRYYRSLEDGRKTAVGIFLLVVLGFSNFLFAYQYWLEAGVVLVVWGLALWLFRGTFKQIWGFMTMIRHKG